MAFSTNLITFNSFFLVKPLPTALSLASQTLADVLSTPQISLAIASSKNPIIVLIVWSALFFLKNSTSPWYLFHYHKSREYSMWYSLYSCLRFFSFLLDTVNIIYGIGLDEENWMKSQFAFKSWNSVRNRHILFRLVGLKMDMFTTDS